MSMLQRIRDQHQQNEGAAVEQMDAEAADAAKPDAGESMRERRKAHSDKIRSMPDQMLEDELPGPGEQEAHTKLDKALVEMIHGQGSTQKMLKAVFSAGDVVEGVGTVAADVVIKLKRFAPEATEDVLASIGERAVEEITELAELADPQINLDEEDMSEAYSIGMQRYMQGFKNEMDDSELRGFLANG